MIGAPPGCRLPASVAIGLIEGPVDAGHPALRGARLRQGSALLPGERPDDTGHGTAMAALIVGEDPRGALAGFAPPTPARRSISPRPAWTSGWRRDAAAATPASGTSYAAPIVTALAARLRARSADALRAALRRSAADLGPPGRDTGTGWGLVRASGC
jgi:subtilisin family serine protease